MPTYEFVCTTCGNHFDKVLHFNDPLSEVSCPSGHQHTRRIFTPPSIIFKGSGFYVTDSRKQHTPAANKAT